MIRPEIQSLATPISKLKAHPQNVRQGDVGAISQSLEQHGQYRPIVVQKSTGFILAGNHTFKAAVALHWKEIAATFVDCDDEQALRILLVDNRANDLAMYDDAALAEVLKYLDSTNAGLEGTLFDGDDLDDLMFRLNGTLGAGHETLSAQDALEGYLGRDTKTLALPFSSDDYESVITQCNDMRKKLNIETNSQLFQHLLGQKNVDR